jgi:hypothetical protein
MDVEHQLKITGAATLLDALHADQRLNIGGELEIYSVEKRDNQDGTFKIVYKSKFVSAVDAVQNGKKIPSKDKAKKSQRNRRRFAELQLELESTGEIEPMDEESFYAYMMDGIYNNAYETFKLIHHEQ